MRMCAQWHMEFDFDGKIKAEHSVVHSKVGWVSFLLSLSAISISNNRAGVVKLQSRLFYTFNMLGLKFCWYRFTLAGCMADLDSDLSELTTVFIVLGFAHS